MKIFSVVYTAMIIAWALLNVLLILGTSHSYNSIDLDYKVVAISSLIIFPLTCTFLFMTVGPNNKSILLYLFSILFIVLTSLIFVYYTYQLIADEYSDPDESLLFALFPLLIVAVTGFFVVNVIKKMIKTE